jgi:hypothetical protein
MKNKTAFNQICRKSFIAMITPFIVFGATQATFYVDPINGKDNNTGTIDQPFKTITKARDVVRTINRKITGDITVYLRDGTYFISKTIEFNTRDSGTSGHPIIYCNYPGETPVISGGKFINGWTLFDAKKNIYKASNVTFNFRQLYVNGVKAIRARTPNPGNFFRTTGADIDNKNIQVNASQVSNWGNLTNVEMHINTFWADNVIRLQSYSASGATAFLKFQQPDQTVFINNWTPVASNRCYFFENAYEFIDTAGEWYLNRSTNTLYYKAQPNENMSTASVIAPSVETLVKIMGDSLGSPTHDIWMQGITFAHSTYLRASDSGYLVIQAGQYLLPTTTGENQAFIGRPASAVYVACASNLRFERNVFIQLAATGLDFNYGTHDNLVIGNTFYDIGGCGISCAKFFQDGYTYDHPYNPVDSREICRNDSIISNSISNVTTEIFGACGIACGYPQSIRIEHNEVSYCNYTGVSVGWGWTTVSNAMKNNCIKYNNVHHVMQILCDGGAIYTLSKQPNSQIIKNYVHDFQKSSWADYGIASIFLDEETSGYTVSDNVRANVPSMWYNGSYNDNVSVNNDEVDSSTIKNSGIEPEYSNIATINTVVLREQKATTGFKISPLMQLMNNVKQLFIADGRFLKIAQNKNSVTFLVIDLTGRTILQKTLNGISIYDLKNSGLAKGVYLVRAFTIDQKFESQKINFIW